jgi:hypothetical protein
MDFVNEAIEIRAFKEGSRPQIGRFNFRWANWHDDARSWIEDLNRREYNIYAVRNPINPNSTGSASKRQHKRSTWCRLANGSTGRWSSAVRL